MGAPLTRFYVQHSGIKAELFGVRDLTNGDLVIKHRPMGYTKVPNHYWDQSMAVEEKYSVHVSPKAAGHTITHTTIFEDIPDEKNSWFVECEDGPFLAHLYSRRHTSLVERVFKMRERSKDTQVCVAEFDITKNSLITHTFVSDEKVSIDPELPYDITSHRFSRFAIHVVKMFMPFKALEVGCHYEKPDGANPKTLNQSGVGDTIKELNAAMCRSFMSKALPLVLNENGPLIDAMPATSWVSQGPLIDVLTSIHSATRIERYPT